MEPPSVRLGMLCVGSLETPADLKLSAAPEVTRLLVLDSEGTIAALLGVADTLVETPS